MHRNFRTIFVIFLTAALALAPVVPALAQDFGESREEEKEGPAGAMAFDFLLIRPFGIVATILGSTIFALSYPFSRYGGNADAAYQKLIMGPVNYTFLRPLGYF